MTISRVKDYDRADKSLVEAINRRNDRTTIYLRRLSTGRLGVYANGLVCVGIVDTLEEAEELTTEIPYNKHAPKPAARPLLSLDDLGL